MDAGLWAVMDRRGLGERLFRMVIKGQEALGATLRRPLDRTLILVQAELIPGSIASARAAPPRHGLIGLWRSGGYLASVLRLRSSIR